MRSDPSQRNWPQNDCEFEITKMKSYAPSREVFDAEHRRMLLATASAGLAWLLLPKPAAAQSLADVTLHVRGPRSAVLYPLEPAVNLGFDSSEYPDAQRYPINSMVMPRWSGSKP